MWTMRGHTRTGVESNMSEVFPVSQPLSALLDRVKREEAEAHGANKQTLLDIALHVLTNHDYSKADYSQAVALLAKYRLCRLIDKRHPIHCQQLINAERSKLYTRRCANCGLSISSEKSLKTGLGRVCRKKLSPRTSMEAS
jgi:hypothetical protein